eukprot:6111564-Pyramimonas_sp.AAC.1
MDIAVGSEGDAELANEHTAATMCSLSPAFNDFLQQASAAEKHKLTPVFVDLFSQSKKARHSLGIGLDAKGLAQLG